VDVWETPNKRSGAYCASTYYSHPYLLLNYNETYSDMSTLAHEMGHAMHSFFSNSSQTAINSNYPIFTAEVASTVNEILLQNHLLKTTTDPKLRLFYVNEFLEAIRGTVFTQVMFGEFELKIHETAEAGKPLTAKSMGAIYRDIVKRYYGPALVLDEEVDGYWIRIPHFYYNFYVYQYATSYSGGTNIAKRILRGEPGARESYLKMLNAGNSDYAVNLLKAAGVDMTTPKPVEDTMALFGELLDELEALLKAQGKL
jgi:oligoendopeptidase F